MSATISSTASGSRLLEACNYDRRLCGAIIASQSNWQELLDSIPDTPMRRNVAHVVWQIREALGKEDFDYAREITQGQ
jgi:hypothetical protein